MAEFTAGELICFSTGCYSDYSLCGHFVVLQDVPLDTLKSVQQKLEKESETMKEKGNYMYDIHERFISALIREGFLASIPVREIHLGSYSELDTDWNGR